METAGRLSGIGPIGISRRARRSSLIRHLKLIWQLAGLAALATVALTAPGCTNASSQTAGPVYAGPAEYAAYGYPENPYLVFDPFLYGYYWSVPYYNNGYPGYGGDGDHDCDDGFCGPHGGGKPPHVPVRVGSLAERLPPRDGTEVSQRSITSVRSGAPANSNLSVGDHATSVSSSGFGGGFHSGGFGGGGFGAGGFHGGGFGGGGFSGAAHR
jgi:predicted pyridoxine 5'-phosphate oxidase superfamily flavin-nucleotide-binding protein